MPKLTAPLFSLSASGRLAKELIYQTSKGRRIVKKYAAPTDPKSAKQLAQRAVFRSASKFWAGGFGSVPQIFVTAGAGDSRADGNWVYTSEFNGRPRYESSNATVLWDSPSWRLYGPDPDFDYLYFASDALSPWEAGPWVRAPDGTLPAPRFIPPTWDVKPRWNNLSTWKKLNRSGWQLFSRSALAAGSIDPNASFVCDVDYASPSSLMFFPLRLSDRALGDEAGTFFLEFGDLASATIRRVGSTGDPDMLVFNVSAYFGYGKTMFCQIVKPSALGKDIARSGMFEIAFEV